MDLHRLRPLATVTSLHAGECTACGSPVKRSERAVHLYGELFHSDCAFYRPARKRGKTRAKPA
jgi:hypothetical protein